MTPLKDVESAIKKYECFFRRYKISGSKLPVDMEQTALACMRLVKEIFKKRSYRCIKGYKGANYLTKVCVEDLKHRYTEIRKGIK